MNGYARPGTVKLVWPKPGKGFSGLQEHWMYYKANLRELLEAQKKDASWENRNAGKLFNGYKKADAGGVKQEWSRGIIRGNSAWDHAEGARDTQGKYFVLHVPDFVFTF